MKPLSVLNALLTLTMCAALSACATRPDPEVRYETRLVETDCSAGIDLDATAPGPVITPPAPGTDLRAWAERLFAAYLTDRGKHTALHGAVSGCEARREAE